MPAFQYCTLFYRSEGGPAASWWYLDLPGRPRERLQVDPDPKHTDNADYVRWLNILGEDGWQLVTNSEDTPRPNLRVSTYVMLRAAPRRESGHEVWKHGLAETVRRRSAPPQPAVPPQEITRRAGKRKAPPTGPAAEESARG